MKKKFNYSDNNGKVIVGNGDYKFTTEWSRASNKSIHFYDHPGDIKGIALAENLNDGDFKQNVSKLNLAELNYSSGSRTLGLKDVAVFQNTKGEFLFVKPIRIKDKQRGDDEDSFEFEYDMKGVSTSQMIWMEIQVWFRKNWKRVLYNQLLGFCLGDLIDAIKNRPQK